MIIKGFLESVFKNIKSKKVKDFLVNHLNKHVTYEIKSN